MPFKFIAFISALFFFSTLLADNTLTRPDAHAPIGIMGDHTHGKGEWMLSYRYMNMDMDGNRDDTDRISTSNVFDTGFLVAPLDMTMEMHMFGVMYAPSEQLTLMAIMPFVDLTMDHLASPSPPAMMAALANREFTTESDGIGDIKLGGLYSINKSEGSNLIANFTVSIPTGSINEEGVLANPSAGELQLPYPMQIGSGTYDLIPGITYTKLKSDLSLGAQAKATIRIGENDNSYALGDRYMASAWLAKSINNNISFSGRLAYDSWKDVDGEDENLNTMLVGFNGGIGAVPTIREDLRAGNRTDIGLGVNIIFKGKGVSNHRIALEWLSPIRQDLDGPQLETDSIIALGYQVGL